MCSLSGASTSEEKLAAENAIEQIYELIGQEPPAIIWCRSAYQLLTLPSLIFAILHSDLWHFIYGELTGETALTDKQWQQQWNEAWSEIWLNAGAPILYGINATSRIGHEYGYLEGAMISDLKRALANNLRNSRWQHAQKNLKREMYRKFWYAPRGGMFENNFYETISDCSNTVFEECEKTSYLKDEISDLIEHASLQGQALVEFFEGFGQRLGSEPNLQFARVHWTAENLEWMATAQYLLQLTADTSLRSITDRLLPWLTLGIATSGVLPFPGAVFLCERPLTCTLSERFQLHNDSGPALTYSDGLAQYIWNDIVVPEKVILEKDSISVEEIEKETNVEIRRVMLEIYGEERYVRDSGIEAVHEDATGILYRKEFSNDEALVMVKVINSSPEPDGTFKHYFLRVPPDIKTAQEAVAWTFEFEDFEDYDPEIET